MFDAKNQSPAGNKQRGLGFLARTAVILGVISIGWVLFIVTAPVGQWLPEATQESHGVDFLFMFMLATGGVISIYVWGLCVAFAIRFRFRKTDSADAIGSQRHGHTGLEIAWTAAPAALLGVLVTGAMVVWAQENRPLTNPVQLYVHGYQWNWGFQLHGYGLTTDLGAVELPMNKPVYVSEWSNDVIHSFWVPEFRIKQDVIPLANDANGHKQYVHEEFTPNRLGTYPVICTEFCGGSATGGPGASHAGMCITNAITIVTQKEFDRWVRSVKAHPPKLIATGGASPCQTATYKY